LDNPDVHAYVLLPPDADAKRAVDLLIETQTLIGIRDMNGYIFARFSENSPMNGCTELREVV